MSASTLARVGIALVLASSVTAFAQPASAPETMPAPAEAPTAAPASAPDQVPAAAPMTADATEGKVAYYGRKFAGRKTASGERFNPDAMTMAHRSLPFGTRVRVTNLSNKKSVVVRVNDRGPTQPDRVGDLSSAAARKIGMTRRGVADVRLEVVGAARAR